MNFDVAVAGDADAQLAAVQEEVVKHVIQMGVGELGHLFGGSQAALIQFDQRSAPNALHREKIRRR
ncbi:hypothetical protein [Sphingobium sp. TomTYG45]